MWSYDYPPIGCKVCRTLFPVWSSLNLGAQAKCLYVLKIEIFFVQSSNLDAMLFKSNSRMQVCVRKRAMSARFSRYTIKYVHITEVIMGCLQFREVFLTHDHLAIAMEYAAGGDMFQHVTKRRGLSEDESRWFFQQLILGLDYCHKMVSSVHINHFAQS